MASDEDPDDPVPLEESSSCSASLVAPAPQAFRRQSNTDSVEEPPVKKTKVAVKICFLYNMKCQGSCSWAYFLIP